MNIRLITLAIGIMLTLTPSAFAAGKPVATPSVGGQRDLYGCLIGAGESYSTLRNSCVRLFETAIRIDAIAKQSNAVLSAFVLFQSEEGEGNVEIFLPSRKTSFIMRQVKGDNAGQWKSKTLSLNYWKGMYSLDNSKGKTLYQGMAGQ
jgi:hypothetical protein